MHGGPRRRQVVMRGDCGSPGAGAEDCSGKPGKGSIWKRIALSDSPDTLDKSV